MRTWLALKAIPPQITRGVMALCLLPTLVLRPGSVEAFLIHEHGGHAGHMHALSHAELEDWQDEHKHRHGGPEHDGDTAADADDGILIVLGDTKVILSTGRLHSAVSVSASSTAPLAFASPSVIDATKHRPPTPHFLQRTRSPSDTLLSILLSNHALLL